MMAETLVSPDVTSLLIAWLTAELPDLPDQAAVGVYRAVPNPRPSSFVTVQLLGGAGRTVENPPIDRAQVEVNAWASTAAAAHDLAQNARALIHAAQGAVLGSTQVYTVEDFGPPVDEPDPLSDQARFTFRVELTVRTRRIT
jgi:hypothetical protein